MSVHVARVAPAAEIAPPSRNAVLFLGTAAAVALGLAVLTVAGPRTLLLYGFGLAFGLVLFHSRFGFTAGWRQLVAVGQGRALRAHMLMIAIACTLFSIVLGTGFGLAGAPTGFLQPVGIALVVGSFLFGVGMQLGGSCASGTLYAVGSGHTAILLTLGGFVVGSLLAILSFPFWAGIPQGVAVSFANTPLGYPGALGISLLLIGAVVGVSLLVQRRRNPPPVEEPPTARGFARILRGSWPLWVGAVALAVLNAATLWASGSPWGITFAFGLWGSKILDGLGVDVGSWAYWQVPNNATSFANSVLADKTSVMDFGIIIGALIASAAAGAFVLHRKVPWKLGVGAVIGGILMGYGARIAGGCNIGAYFSGIASFSLHGWVWGLVAIGGTFAGLALRPLFGLTNPKPSDSVC
jgi:uncharacterized protein